MTIRTYLDRSQVKLKANTKLEIGQKVPVSRRISTLPSKISTCEKVVRCFVKCLLLKKLLCSVKLSVYLKTGKFVLYLSEWANKQQMCAPDVCAGGISQTASECSKPLENCRTSWPIPPRVPQDSPRSRPGFPQDPEARNQKPESRNQNPETRN